MADQSERFVDIFHMHETLYHTRFCDTSEISRVGDPLPVPMVGFDPDVVTDFISNALYGYFEPRRFKRDLVYWVPERGSARKP